MHTWSPLPELLFLRLAGIKLISQMLLKKGMSLKGLKQPGGQVPLITQHNGHIVFHTGKQRRSAVCDPAVTENKHPKVFDGNRKFCISFFGFNDELSMAQ